MDIDDIGNLEDLPRLVFIDEEFENLVVVNDVENLLEISTKKRNWKFYNIL